MRDGRNNNKGFSLTEVLLAIGTLAIGMIFIAGVFPVGLQFATHSTEQTLASVIANEGFAKVRLIAGDPAAMISADNLAVDRTSDFWAVTMPVRHGAEIGRHVFTYPSTERVFTERGPTPEERELDERKQYCWSALCRRVDAATPDVQVTIFVCRRYGAGAEYWVRQPPSDQPVPNKYLPRPTPLYLRILPVPGGAANELKIDKLYPGDPNEWTFVNDGYIILDDQTGRLYRALERTADGRIILDRRWEGNLSEEGGRIWVVPPTVGRGRYPCLAVYQKIIQFPTVARPKR